MNQDITRRGREDIDIEVECIGILKLKNEMSSELTTIIRRQKRNKKFNTCLLSARLVNWKA